MSFLNSVIKDSKNEYASFVSDGIAAGDIESFIDTGSYMAVSYTHLTLPTIYSV